MSIHQIVGNIMARARVPETNGQTLRPGQIIQGDIIKIYPDNKALIQLGGQKMVAQLEASLNLGERYHFQVQAGDDMIHLKVLSQQVTAQDKTSVTNLLNQLGIKENKLTSELVKSLIQSNIPFEKSQLIKALPLLADANNKIEATLVFKNMIANKLPITNAVFQAMFTRATTGLSEQMKALLTVLNENITQVKTESNAEQPKQAVQVPQNIAEIKAPVLQQVAVQGSPQMLKQNAEQANAQTLKQVVQVSQKTTEIKVPVLQQTIVQGSAQTTQLPQNTVEIKAPVLTQVAEQANVPQKNQIELQQNIAARLSTFIEKPLEQNALNSLKNNVEMFQLFKAADMINSRITFSTWNKAWEQYESKTANLPQNNERLPFGLNKAEIQVKLEQLKTGMETGNKDLQTFTDKWARVLTEVTNRQQALPKDAFEQLKQELIVATKPLLENEAKQNMFKNLQNNPEQLKQLETILNTLKHTETATKLEQFVAGMKQINHPDIEVPKALFMKQVGQMLTTSGLNHENLIANDKQMQQTETLKSALIQLVQTSDGTVHERGQQLLHIINGMQMQTVHETNNFLQASLQLPGEMLGLKSDVQLDFEGKKTEDGKINPDYCRILFYLNLENLKETVIDMHVQKRSVSITIFNDEDALGLKSKAFQPLLEKGLNSISYHLAKVTVKPMQAKQEQVIPKTKKAQESTYEGVDYRI